MGHFLDSMVWVQPTLLQEHFVVYIEDMTVGFTAACRSVVVYNYCLV